MYHAARRSETRIGTWGGAALIFLLTFAVAALAIAFTRDGLAVAAPTNWNVSTMRLRADATARKAGDTLQKSLNAISVRTSAALRAASSASSPEDNLPAAALDSAQPILAASEPTPRMTQTSSSGIDAAPIAASNDASEASDGIVSDASAADSDAAMRSVRARAYAGKHDFKRARQEANAILREQPNNPDGLRAAGVIEDSAGRWRQAAQAWGKLEAVTGDEAATRRKQQILDANKSSLSAQGFYEGSDDDKQYGARATAILKSIDRPEVTISLENRQAEADSVVRAGGVSGPASLTRQRLLVEMADNFEAGRAAVQMTATNDAVGGRASFKAPTRWGEWGVEASVNEPYWLYTSGMGNKAVSDTVAASVATRWGKISARAKAGAINYGIEDDRSLANSTRITIGADAALSENPKSPRFVYVMDAEYFGSKGTKKRPDGSEYQPMPFTNREVHSFGVYKSMGDASEVTATLGAGYRIDRYGPEGFFGSLSAETDLGAGVRLGVRGEYSKASVRGETDQPYSVGEIYLKKEF